MRLINPTGRNTQAHVVTTKRADFFFSYETCIAVAWAGKGVRIKNNWGPTTGRHFAELNCGHYPVVEQETFDAIVERLT